MERLVIARWLPSVWLIILAVGVGEQHPWIAIFSVAVAAINFYFTVPVEAERRAP